MRISRPHLWMDIAEVLARRATCYRGGVGALIIKDRDVVSTGYNGPPSGEPHCTGNDCPRSASGGCQRSLHAERNAIERAYNKTDGAPLYNHDLYSTFGPCLVCAGSIVGAKIARVFYRYPYRVKEGIELLIRANVAVYRVTTSGIIILEASGLIMAGHDLA